MPEQHHHSESLSESQTEIGKKNAPEWKQKRAAVNAQLEPEAQSNGHYKYVYNPERDNSFSV